MSGQLQFEQRHFRPWLPAWSDWYASNEEAYREHLSGPVSFYEVRQTRETLLGTGRNLADATNNPPSDPGTEQREAGR